MTLEPDRDEVEGWLRILGGMALEQIEGLDEASARGCVGKEGLALAREASVAIGEDPLPGGAKEIAQIVAKAAQAALVTTGPGYLAYVPGGGLPSAAVAGFVGDIVNRFTGLSTAAPGLTRLEADALAWLAAQFGLPRGAAGLFTSGGSMANFSAIVAARHNKLGEVGDYRGAIAYTSDQCHHSVRKSIALAGIPPTNVRGVATDDHFRLDPAALREAIERDVADGLTPFLLVSAAGTTNTGAVDPLAELADICREHEIWHHVDGAYGGAFVLCSRGRARLRGIERADSITFDPHKGMFLPYGTGCLLVRDPDTLRRSHGSHGDYLQDFDALEREGEPPNPAELGPELSRPNRGLRVWIPLCLHGARAFREALDEKLALAEYFHAGLVRLRDGGRPIEIVGPPQLSTVAFRVGRRADEPLRHWNRRNAALMAGINERDRVYLSSTTLPVHDGDAFTLRVCVLSFRTHRRHMDAGLEDLEAALSAGLR